MRRWLDRIGIALWGIIGAVVLATVVAVLLITQTDWGRRHVLAFGLDQLASRVHGYVRIRAIHGSLLTGARLDDVLITDSLRRPFLRADTLELRYSLRSLLARHLVFGRARLVNAVVVLDRPPRETWNFARIFPTTPPRPNQKPGFGSWVLIENLSVRNATLVVRNAWSPPDTLSGPALQQVIAHALSPANRQWIVPVPGGYQSISEFGSINGFLPVMRVADPDSANRLIEIGTLSMYAVPYRPPGVIVRELHARTVITRDSLLFDSVRVATAGTLAGGLGAYALNGEGARVQLALRPFSFVDARFLMPALPAGGGHMGLAFTSHKGRTRIVASNMDVHAESAAVTGDAELQVGPAFFRVGPSNVAFGNVDTRLVERYLPQVPLKVGGTLAGALRLDGAPASMRVAAWTDFRERAGPTSRVVADGRVGGGAAGFEARGLRLRFQPLYLSVVRGYAPKLPYRGRVTGEATLTGSGSAGFALAADLVDDDPSAGRSHLLADGRVTPRNGLTARGLHLRFAPLQVALLRPIAPRLPYGGTVTGTTTLTGSTRSALQVVADLVHQDPKIGRSHVTANGSVRVAGGFAARGLRLGFDPLQVAVVRPFYPRLPISGALTGHSDLTFSAPMKQLAAAMDLEHTGPTGYTHVVGHAAATWRAPGFFDVDVRAPALALGTVGAFAPASGLRGEASGDMVARGNLANLTADLDLTLAKGGGSVRTRGVLDLAGARTSYDFTSSFEAFDAGAATTHAPRTSLSGTLHARGSGTDPATATAFLSADLVDARAAGTPRLDTTIVRARLAGGLATFDRGHLRLGSAAADVAGSFGLAAGRSGTLHYFFRVDTVSRFLAHLPADTGSIPLRPLVQARRLALARADSARDVEATAVQRAAVGYPPPPPLRVDSLPLRRDTLDGSLTSQGTLTGNVKQFSARGTAQARHLSLGANRVGAGVATFTLTGFGTPNPLLHLQAFGDTVDVGGFAFDSARALVDYNALTASGRGHGDLALFQDSRREYRVRSDFDLAAGQKRLALQQVFLRFDTTRWTSAHPATLSWADGLTVNDLQLASNVGGYVRASGRIPNGTPGDLRLDMEGVQLGDVTALLQDTMSAIGILGLHARVQGSARAPVFAGTAALAHATYGGKPFPDTRATLDYADARLSSHASFFRGPKVLAVAEATVPVNLALSGVVGRRVDRAAPLRVDLRADSLPLEALPSFTAAVSEVHGRVRGNLAVRGTLDHPSSTGTLLLDLGSMRVSSTGVLFTDITGQVRLRGDSAYVDSLVAHSGGPVRVAGMLGLASLTRPSFNLAVAANDATVIDNEWGRVRADAQIRARGPYTALRVTGTANILGGVIYAPEMQSQHATNLDDPTLSGVLAQDTSGIGATILPPPNPLLQNLDLNVAVEVQPDTWVRNSSANVEVYTTPDAGPLRVHMNRSRQVLTATGTISTDRGEYTYAGRVFQLSAGSATFLGGPTLDPLLQLSALYQVQRQGLEALVIQIQVDGTLRKPRVTLASNAQPPLPQSDLLAFLAFGRPASSLLGLQASPLGGVGQGGLTGIPALAEQQLASLAVGAVVDQTVSEIEQQGSRSGLDVFRVHPGELPPEAAFQGYFQNLLTGTEIEAGKYLTPNIFVEARGRTSTLPGLSVDYRTPFGLTWSTTWEPRYLPVLPSFSTMTAARVRAFGTFLLWRRRF